MPDGTKSSLDESSEELTMDMGEKCVCLGTITLPEASQLSATERSTSGGGGGSVSVGGSMAVRSK
jgi:hypothetical protein